MLEIRNLTVRFGGLKALDDVSFTVDRGEIVGLIGPNGAGKTTVFNAVSRFVPPSSGTIRFEGKALLSLPAHAIIGAGIARTFQNLGLFPFLSVTDNVLLGLHHRIRTSPWGQFIRPPESRPAEQRMRRQVGEFLEQSGLGALKDAYVHGLPYGTRKFIEVSRAFVARPKLVLLDEPAAGLTSGEAERMRGLILRARAEFGVTILLIEHDMGLVMRTCERVIALDFGKVIAEGTPNQIQNDARVIEAYLGTPEPEETSHA